MAGGEALAIGAEPTLPSLPSHASRSERALVTRHSANELPMHFGPHQAATITARLNADAPFGASGPIVEWRRSALTLCVLVRHVCRSPVSDSALR